MYTPSLESTVHELTYVSRACDVGHRAAKALQWLRFRGSLPGTSPAACLVLPQSGMVQASPAEVPPPLALQGLAPHQTANAEEVRVIGQS